MDLLQALQAAEHPPYCAWSILRLSDEKVLQQASRICASITCAMGASHEEHLAHAKLLQSLRAPMQPPSTAAFYADSLCEDAANHANPACQHLQKEFPPCAEGLGLLSSTLRRGVVLEQQVEAPGNSVDPLEHGAQLQPLWVAAPAIKDVMVVPHHDLQLQIRKANNFSLAAVEQTCCFTRSQHA